MISFTDSQGNNHEYIISAVQQAMIEKAEVRTDVMRVLATVMGFDLMTGCLKGGNKEESKKHLIAWDDNAVNAACQYAASNYISLLTQGWTLSNLRETLGGFPNPQRRIPKEATNGSIHINVTAGKSKSNTKKKTMIILMMSSIIPVLNNQHPKATTKAFYLKKKLTF